MNRTGEENFAFFVGPVPFGATWSAAYTRPDGSFVWSGMDGSIYSVSEGGECQWRTQLWAPVSAIPALDRQRAALYLGAWDDWFYALDDATGNIKWKFQTRYV